MRLKMNIAKFRAVPFGLTVLVGAGTFVELLSLASGAPTENSGRNMVIGLVITAGLTLLSTYGHKSSKDDHVKLALKQQNKHNIEIAQIGLDQQKDKLEKKQVRLNKKRQDLNL